MLLCVGTARSDEASPSAAPSAAAIGAENSEDAWHPISYTRGPKTSNKVALTFDDGPHPKLTPQLIDILKSEGVPATFFLLGDQVRKFPGTARAIRDAGFEVANHSYTHAKLTSVSKEQLATEIESTQDIIEEQVGIRPTLFRPPYGATDSRVKQMCEEHRLDIVGWAVDSSDWKRGMTEDSIAERVIRLSRGGSIILLHDIHSRTVRSVPAIIAGLREKGLEFTTVSELLAARKRDIAAGVDSGYGGGANTSPKELKPVPTTLSLENTSFKRYRTGTKKQ